MCHDAVEVYPVPDSNVCAFWAAVAAATTTTSNPLTKFDDYCDDDYDDCVANDDDDYDLPLRLECCCSYKRAAEVWPGLAVLLPRRRPRAHSRPSSSGSRGTRRLGLRHPRATPQLPPYCWLLPPVNRGKKKFR